MKLKSLIQGMRVLDIRGNTDLDISGISYDSRSVMPQALFVCIEGFKTDGHQYLDMAIKKGAVAIVVQKKIEVSEDITVITVADSRDAISFLADRFFGHPTGELTLVGVTGTKGKTTTTYMIKSILEERGSKVGLIGTVSNSIGEEIIPTERTTPEALELQGLFRDMLEKKADCCVMEVSSHALELKRVQYSDFKIGIFTNLTQDHLDFHQTFDNYLEAKAKLFDMCQVGIVNIDSDYGEKIRERAACKIFTLGIQKDADIRAVNIVKQQASVSFDVISEKYRGRITVNIPGLFTVYNALSAIGAAMILDIPFEAVAAGLAGVKVPGRAEVVETQGDYTVMIDYAHSPDSLENILTSVKQFAKGRLISVFGCGGDRDKTKRPLMGKISGNLADFTIITSDNPRSEEPGQIIAQIEEGIKPTGAAYITIEDRRRAIKYAMENAKKDDMIVVAGKGHETYQIFGDQKIHFDEREVVAEIVNELKEN